MPTGDAIKYYWYMAPQDISVEEILVAACKLVVRTCHAHSFD